LSGVAVSGVGAAKMPQPSTHVGNYRFIRNKRAFMQIIMKEP
jgi:hypothetical protein